MAAGLAPENPDEMAPAPLHLAARTGLPEAAAWPLGLGADIDLRNAHGGDALETCLHGSEHAPKGSGIDHIGCMRHLLAGGGAPGPHLVQQARDADMAAFFADWLEENPPECVPRAETDAATDSVAKPRGGPIRGRFS